jgi:peroxiredoxin
MGHVRPEMGPPQPGDIAPDFDLPRLDKSTVSLSSLRGSWVLLHFTASWCPYCDSEISHLGEIANAYAARNVKVVVVDVKEDWGTWQPYAQANVAPAVIALHDATGAACERFAPPRAQPSFTDRAQVMLDSTLILDPRGVIRLFLLPDSAHFDPTFAAVKRELDRMMGQRPPQAQGSPTHDRVDSLLPPEQVVDLQVIALEDQLVAKLHVVPGYHIMSNNPSKPNYIPTRLSTDATSGITFGEPLYPAASSFTLSDQEIAVFQGDLEIKLPYRTAPATQQLATAQQSAAAPQLTGTLKYQACTTDHCLFPTTKAFSVALPAPH